MHGYNVAIYTWDKSNNDTSWYRSNSTKEVINPDETAKKGPYTYAVKLYARHIL